MREMERHNRDLRRREAETRDFGRMREVIDIDDMIDDLADGEPGILFIEKEAKIEPLKHMK